MSLISLLEQVTYIHWIAFGFALLTFELMGAAGYFLWLGCSAFIISLLTAILPISWQMQWISFSVFCLASTWLWWRHQFKRDRISDKSRGLNQKQNQLIGLVVTLEEDIPVGKSRLKVADGTWPALSATAIPAGTQVVVTDVDGLILKIKPSTEID